MIFGWVVQNRSMLFGKKKSARCATGSYGLKKNNKILELRDCDADADEVAKALFDMGKSEYVKVSYKLDKNAIKSAMDEEADAELLDKYFVKTQDEEFYVKPDKDSDKIEEAM